MLISNNTIKPKGRSLGLAIAWALLLFGFSHCRTKPQENGDLYLLDGKPHLKDDRADRLLQTAIYWQYRNVSKLDSISSLLLAPENSQSVRFLGSFYKAKADFYSKGNLNSLRELKTLFDSVKTKELDFMRYEICFLVNNYYYINPDENIFKENSKWVDERFGSLSTEVNKPERVAILYGLVSYFKYDEKEQQGELNEALNGLKDQPWGIYHSWLNRTLAFSYRREGDKPKELETFRYTIEKDRANGMPLLACGMLKDLAFSTSGDSALIYIQTAINLAKEVGYISELNSYYSILGHIYVNNKQYSKAFEAYSISQRLDSTFGDSASLLEEITYMGNAYFKMDSLRNYPVADKQYFEKALLLGKTKLPSIRLEALARKIWCLTCYAKCNKINVADELKRLETEKNEDSLFAGEEETITTGTHLQAQLRMKEKDAQIYGLEMDNKLGVEKTKSQNWAIVLSILVLVGASIIFWSRRNSQQKLKEKQDFIEKRNNEMGVLIGQLEESNNNLENFAQVAAHDLKSPLNTIRYGVMALKKKIPGKFDKDDLETLDTLCETSNNFMEMINGILNFSTITVGIDQADPISLENKLAFVLDSLAPLIVQKRAVVYVNGPLPILKVDKSLLTQLLLNILGNSLKYAKSDMICKIQVSCKSLSDGFSEICIRDNGIGISRNKLTKVFELFERGDISQEEYEGNGIGLATCKKIVSHYNGKIWIESELGEGTTVFFTLPESV